MQDKREASPRHLRHHERLQQASVTLSTRGLTSTVTLTRLRIRAGGRHSNQSCCCACGDFLLLCLGFLHSNCFHMAGNVILQLPPVIPSLSHQGFSAASPNLHPLMGSEEFHTTRWSHV